MASPKMLSILSFYSNVQNAIDSHLFFLFNHAVRLRQKIPENVAVTDANVSSEPDSQNGCSDVDDIIHVKVSIFVKHTHRGGNNRVVNSANYGSSRRGK